jgi:hypothetical protein
MHPRSKQLAASHTAARDFAIPLSFPGEQPNPFGIFYLRQPSAWLFRAKDEKAVCSAC